MIHRNPPHIYCTCPDCMAWQDERDRAIEIEKDALYDRMVADLDFAQLIFEAAMERESLRRLLVDVLQGKEVSLKDLRNELDAAIDKPLESRAEEELERHIAEAEREPPPWVEDPPTDILHKRQAF